MFVYINFDLKIVINKMHTDNFWTLSLNLYEK